MTERNTDGTFASPEPTTGQAAVEEAQGFRAMSMPEAPPASNDGVVDDQIRLEAERLKSSRASTAETDITEIRYQDPTGEKMPENQTVSLDRAATDLGNYHAAQNDVAKATGDADVARFVDTIRAEALAENPEIAKDLGLSKEEVAAAKAAEAEQQSSPSETNEAARAYMAEQATQAPDAYDQIEGLEPATREALKQPQIRSFLEKAAEDSEKAVSAYKASTVEGQQTALAAIFALMPQLQTTPLEHWGAEVQKTAQMDPARARLVVDTASNFDALQQRQQLVQHYEQSQRQHEFDSLKQQYSAASDKALGPMSIAEKMQMTEELADYVGEHGISRAQLVEYAKTNLLLHHPAFQSLAKDAITLRRMQKTAKAVPTRTQAPITRPGTAAHRPSDNSSTVSALQRQLANATTQQQQLKIGAQLLRAKRAS
jgi:hypothetical protein